MENIDDLHRSLLKIYLNSFYGLSGKCGWDMLDEQTAKKCWNFIYRNGKLKR